MGRTAVIVQSNYIPWKGYFELIRQADAVVLYDVVQFTAGDWRNRNRIQTPRGPAWLTIPVQQKGRLGRSVRETRITRPNWAVKHWKTLRLNYGRAAHFEPAAALLEPLYLDEAPRLELLSDVNHLFLRAISTWLGIDTPLSWAADHTLVEGKTERLVSLCQQLDAQTYLSGPAARGYLDVDRFEAAGIAVRWMDYSGWAEYPQLHAPPFEAGVSIVDLLFNLGQSGARAHLVRGGDPLP